MGSNKRKTACREHETLRCVRFLSYIEEGYSQKEAARLAKVPRTTALKWLNLRPSDRRTGKKPAWQNSNYLRRKSRRDDSVDDRPF